MLNKPLNVTIDSDIFDACKYDFSEEGTLGLLAKYVKQNKIKIFLSDIVFKEIEKHVIDKAEEVYNEMRSTKKRVLKNTSESYIKKLGLTSFLEIDDVEKLKSDSKTMWHNYVNELDAEIIDCKCAEIDKIVDDYFSCKPPFENKMKKKFEFPDAIIVNQIKNRFSGDEAVTVVSNDGGVRKAFESFNNAMTFEKLGDLFNYVNRQEEEYNACYFMIKDNLKGFLEEINSMLLDSTNVEVVGLTYDRKGMSGGYDYTETIVDEVETRITDIESIDEITDFTVRATLACKSIIGAECYYEDYENAIWDSEEKTYGYVETIENYEKHKIEHEVSVEINKIDDKIVVFPFSLTLDEDSRTDIKEIRIQEEI